MNLPFSLDLLNNLDLLAAGIAISSIGVLGFIVFFSNKESITNKTLLLFCLSAIFWNITNYLTINLTESKYILWNLRLHIFTTVWYCFFLFQLFYVFPKQKINFSKFYKIILLPFTVFVSIVTLSPITFTSIAQLSSEGIVSKVNNGPGIILFGITVSILISSALFILLRKFEKEEDRKTKRQIQWVLLGFTITFSLHIIFNLILPAFYDNAKFVVLGAVYTFPLIALTSFSVLKYKLFNIKVAGVGLLVFALSVTAFGEVIFADEMPIIIYRSSIFILVLIIGISLIKGVLREVSLREQLEEANKAQQNLIHFITHQIKGFLTKSRNIFAEMMEGTFGPLSDDVRQISEQGLKINTDAVTTVQTILNAANIKTGKIAYNMQQIDLKEFVEKIFDKYKKNAEDKKLAYNLDIKPNKNYQIFGDTTQLNEAFSNLIDNSIRYTPNGSINVSLNRVNDTVNFSIKDTGVGIIKEDMDKIFEEGVRGTDAQKVNVDSTGFGLYIVKKIIEAHNGHITVKSEGRDKGSEFIVELPIK